MWLKVIETFWCQAPTLDPATVKRISLAKGFPTLSKGRTWRKEAVRSQRVRGLNATAIEAIEGCIIIPAIVLLCESPPEWRWERRYLLFAPLWRYAHDDLFVIYISLYRILILAFTPLMLFVYIKSARACTHSSLLYFFKYSFLWNVFFQIYLYL